jgi:phosphoribosylanthranilate isomerase
MTQPIKIKVCGITELAQLQQLQQMQVAYAGLIFYEKSKRYAGKLEASADLIRKLAIPKVGVFVNASKEEVLHKIDVFGLDMVQLHGDEDPEYCASLKTEVAVIKAFRIGDDERLETLVAPYSSACDFFLFDTHSEGFGGSGQSFNWSILEGASIANPFFLSGGIGADDVSKLKRFEHPMLYAIDINSRFEKSPGVKDLDLVGEFISNINKEQNL